MLSTVCLSPLTVGRFRQRSTRCTLTISAGSSSTPKAAVVSEYVVPPELAGGVGGDGPGPAIRAKSLIPHSVCSRPP